MRYLSSEVDSVRIKLALIINVLLLALTFLFVSHLYIAIFLGTSLLVWFFYFLWQRQQLMLARVERKIKGQNVIMPTEHIRFRAVESSGYSQASGMGYIAITENFLFFELVVLDLTITVPTSRIQGAEFVYRLKGVSPGKKMLRIMFVNENGEDDSIAINVKEMEHWRNTIENI